MTEKEISHWAQYGAIGFGLLMTVLFFLGTKRDSPAIRAVTVLFGLLGPVIIGIGELRGVEYSYGLVCTELYPIIMPTIIFFYRRNTATRGGL